MGGEDRRVLRNGSAPRVVPLTATRAADAGLAIDDALEGLVSSVDELACDLAVDEVESLQAIRSTIGSDVRRLNFVGGPDTLGRGGASSGHTRADTVLVMVVVIAFELLVLMILLHG
jgi:hypothetical protein